MPTHPIRQILELLPDPACIATERAEILFANDPFMESLGNEVEKDSIRDLFAVGLFSHEREYRDFIARFAHGNRFQRLTKTMPDLTGEEKKPVQIHATQLYSNHQRNFCFVLAPCADDSDEAVIGTQLTNFLDLVSSFVFQTDLEGRILYANRSFCKVMDCKGLDSFAEIGGFPKIDLEHSWSIWQRRIEELERGKPVIFETHLQRRDGTILPVSITMGLSTEQATPRLTFWARDISERRRREAELRSALIELESLSLKLKKENLFLQQELRSEHRFDQIISVSPAYQPVLQKIRQVAQTDSTVLITGETGTGKELIARAIHANSNRSDRPLVTVNCAAIPAELIESELFGHKKGAFTGADRNRIGRFELADEGTIFLDEIGEMPLALQSRLLRVLQEGEFIPVGGKEVVYTNVRVLAATNRDLKKLVQDNQFRTDLYFRLNVFPIYSIPLRDRPEDIPVLLEYFINKYNEKLNRHVKHVRPQDLARLQRYTFPGNIRELENIVERALILSKGEELELAWEGLTETDLALSENNEKEVFPFASPYVRSHTKQERFISLDTLQKQYIEEVLRHTNGKVSGEGGAAEILGLKPQTLFSKLRKLKIKRK